MTAVKICGLTRVRDALAAVEAGADAIGFVFHPESPRFVTPSRAAEICARLPPGIARIGVFVNESAAAMAVIAGGTGLDAVQICGDEAPEVAAAMDLPTIRVWRKAADPNAIAHYPATAMLVDADISGSYGGSGRPAEESTIEAVRAGGKPWILAGGLTPVAARLAIDRYAPDAVDVSSWVESQPGVKDRARMFAFVAAVKRRKTSGGGFQALLAGMSTAPSQTRDTVAPPLA